MGVLVSLHPPRFESSANFFPSHELFLQSIFEIELRPLIREVEWLA